MKKMSVLILGMIFLWSCSDKYENILNDSENEEIGTKSVVNGQFNSISNPTLLSDWENTSRILLSTGSSITSPWMDNTMTSMPANFTKDIKKEDGWVMLFHTFKELNYNLHLNYIVFYNQLTGFMKVFYYEENNIAQNNNGFVWVVKTGNGEKTSLFNMGKYYVDLADKNNQILLSNVSTNPAAGIKKGWNGFEWQIPYSSDYRNMLITIDSYNEQVSDYSFSGITSSTIEGTIMSQSKGSNGILSSLANLVGTPAKNLVSRIASSSGVGPGLAGKIQNIPSSSYTNLIKSGLNSVFGSTTITTTQDVKLSASGTIDLTGSSSTIGGNSVPPLRFNLYDIMQGNIVALSSQSMTESFVLNIQSTSSGLNFLGVWELKEKPTVVSQRYTQAETSTPVLVYQDTYRFSNIKANYPTIYTNNFGVQFNPEIEKYITKKSFSQRFVILEKINGQPYRQHDDPYLIRPKKFYEDDNISLVDYYNNEKHSFSETVDRWLPNGVDRWSIYWIDWGEIRGGRALLIVDVDIEYNFNGKTHTLYQSRSYSVNYTPDTYPDPRINENNIINRYQPLFEYNNGINKGPRTLW
ncbi:MAG: hypothetical protein LUH10_07170 [Tannerellaceae bacterium]|nr:hypothetical protein [Tannerellaceae bacterium]